jgi:myo-inositol 2-dehydrogenase / D-chiro-inositol 1-dehydrogenase
MQRGNLSRRGFLTRSVGAMTAAGLPLWYAKETVAFAQQNPASARPAAANDRLHIGAIGTGTNRTRRTGNQTLHGERGYAIMHDAMRQTGVQVIAVADCDLPNALFAATSVRTASQGGSRDCQIYEDYRRLLENRNIDAVTIGTPDHWHATVAIAAMRAGKDVYCEKPLTLTIDEGKALVRVARETGKILQTGTQQRTEMAGRFRLACDLIRNGRVGHVRQITTLIGANPVEGPFPVQPVPEGLNWDFWLGPTPREQYTTKRCHYDFRWWYQYSGGKMTDWGAHHNDIAQWALNMDESGPVSVQGHGTAPSKDPNSFNCHPHFEVTYTYANGSNGTPGTHLVCHDGPPENFIARPNNNGALFEGEDNKWIFVSRERIIASDRRLIDEPLPSGAPRLPTASSHMGNFIECVRTRRQPISNVNVGHRSVTVCHLGNIAIRFFPNQRLTWDPREERFTGEHAEEANRQLIRPYREGYPLGA